ncbi:MAG: tetratricopeptide repeat protein [Spirochaetaceae bacterium]|nr:tetratricopeptide repeat protein [Spirochaetaceae bacterium]
MSASRNRTAFGAQLHRKHAIRTAVILVLFFMIAGSGGIVFAGWKNRQAAGRRELLELWERGSYREAFDASAEKLAGNPMDFLFLTIHGFSAFQLAVAQINAHDTELYADECVRSLRKALLCREGPGDFRIHYVLGKAYYYKGSGYEDLAVRYLEEARDGGYRSADMNELLGLAYAAIHDYRGSVAAFSEALSTEADAASAGVVGDATPSDLLLLNIARSYLALEETAQARAYLLRLLETSRDAAVKTNARLFLGEIASAAGDITAAETWYTAILAEDGENAEAHFRLGELYARGGNATRARAEWRRALWIDPAHRQARTRLNL